MERRIAVVLLVLAVLAGLSSIFLLTSGRGTELRPIATVEGGSGVGMWEPLPRVSDNIVDTAVIIPLQQVRNDQPAAITFYAKVGGGTVKICENADPMALPDGSLMFACRWIPGVGIIASGTVVTFYYEVMASTGTHRSYLYDLEWP